MKKIGAFQEKPRVTSMRRILAFYFALLSGGSFAAGAYFGNMAGVWSGIACAIAVLILLGYTTVQEMSALIQYKVGSAVSGQAIDEEEPDEPIGFTTKER